MYVFFIGYVDAEVFSYVGFVIVYFVSLGGFGFWFGGRGGFIGVIDIGRRGRRCSCRSRRFSRVVEDLFVFFVL